MNTIEPIAKAIENVGEQGCRFDLTLRYPVTGGLRRDVAGAIRMTDEFMGQLKFPRREIEPVHYEDTDAVYAMVVSEGNVSVSVEFYAVSEEVSE